MEQGQRFLDPKRRKNTAHGASRGYKREMIPPQRVLAHTLEARFRLLLCGRAEAVPFQQPFQNGVNKSKASGGTSQGVTFPKPRNDEIAVSLPRRLWVAVEELHSGCGLRSFNPLKARGLGLATSLQPFPDYRPHRVAGLSGRARRFAFF